MNTQVSFTLPKDLKDKFLKKCKENWLTMKAVYIIFMKNYSEWKIDLDISSKDKKK